MTRTMIAAVTLGNGGFEMIEIQQVPVPIPAAGEVRLKVLAAGINNTEINTRLATLEKPAKPKTKAIKIEDDDDAAAASSAASMPATPVTVPKEKPKGRLQRAAAKRAAI